MALPVQHHCIYNRTVLAVVRLQKLSASRPRSPQFCSHSTHSMSSTTPEMSVKSTSDDSQANPLNFPGLKELVNDVVKIYTEGSTPDMVCTLRARYSPEVSFVDPLIVAHPRSSMELQFVALHKLFPVIEMEVGEAEVKAMGKEGEQQGLVQVSIPNTQRYFYSQKSPAAEGEEGGKGGKQVTIEATTTLSVDPLTGTVMKHEDVWHKPSFKLPVLMRCLNTGCMNTVFRLLGWGREIQQAGDGCGSAKPE